MTTREELLAGDRRARALARTEFVRPVVLEAGAGTGKTSALVARVLCWSLGQGWSRAAAALAREHAAPARSAVAERVLSRVVAITFTELAAADMAERVGSGLGLLSRWDGIEPEPLRGLPMADLGPLAADVAELQARARALADAEDALQVSTIHAFAGRILSEHAVAAAVHPGFAVDADGSRARAAADEVLAEELPRAFGERGDGDWEALLAREIGPERLREALGRLLASGEQPELLGGDPLAPERVAAERERLAGWLGRLQGLLAPVFGDRQGLAKSPSTLPAFDALAELGAALRAAADPDAFFAALRAPALDVAASKLGEWAKKGPNQTERKKLGDAAATLPSLAAEGAARLKHLAQIEPEILRPAWRVLHALWSRARRRLDATGALSFQDLLARAARMLGGDPAVRRAVRGAIDQLLIDEFQDTDPLQYEIAGRIGLPDEGAAAGGAGQLPGLFLVGDPKQSIYAWRGADLAAYERFLARVLAAGGERASLVRNFRSSQAVLDEVERLLAPSMRHEPGLQPAFEPLIEAREVARGSPAWLAARPRGAIEHWIAWDLGRGAAPWDTSADDARALEARAIARDLAALAALGLGRDPLAPWSEVAILLRTTTQQETYLEALREAGIPCAVERDRHFYRSREIEDAVSLVSCVLAPSDALSLAAALRSSVVGTPDAALEPLWSRGLPGLCAALGGADPAVLAEIDRAVDGVARELAADAELQVECGLARIPGWPLALRDFLRALGELRDSFAREPADLFVARLRSRLLVEETEAARWLGPHRLANLERFFRELSQSLADAPSGAGGAGGPHAVLRELDARLSGDREPVASAGATQGENAVRLLSIHKAKGLEFALVYLADLHHREKPDTAREFRWACVRAADGSARLELDLFGSPSLGWGEARQRRDDAADRENARLLYVATTRAKDRLVLAGSWPEPGKRASQSPLLDLLLDRRGGAPDLAALAAAGAGGESSSAHEHEGALFRCAAAIPSAPELAAPERGQLALDVARARADAERLAAAREAARVRSALPLSRSASDAGERHDHTSPSAERSALPRPIARAVGTAVHRALEELEPNADAALELPRLQAIAARSLGAALDPGELAAAEAAARTLLERFFRSSLGAHARASATSILGHEVPVLFAPDDGSPTVMIGAIDLAYRDPADGALVVADFKTDPIDAPAARARVVDAYGPQLGDYAGAVALALGAPCRPELVLLASSERVPLAADGRPPSP